MGGDLLDYVKVGGVCLLLLVIAAALPTNVLAQTPQAETSSGATPIISKSLLSDSSGKGETISADNLARRNIGLKPLAKPGSTAASEATKTTEQVEKPATSDPKDDTPKSSQETTATSAVSTATPAAEITPTASQPRSFVSTDRDHC